jgi:hypothetical protein
MHIWFDIDNKYVVTVIRAVEAADRRDGIIAQSTVYDWQTAQTRLIARCKNVVQKIVGDYLIEANNGNKTG